MSTSQQGEPSSPLSSNFSGLDFFFLWAGAAIALPEIWAGGLLTAQGLIAGLAAIVIGHLVGNLVMVGAGEIGYRHRVAAIASTRNAIGRAGSYAAGALNVVQLLGWTAVMIWIATQAIRTLPAMPHLGKVAWTLVIGGATTLWALAGRALWKPLQKIGVLLLFVLSVVMTWRVLHQYPLGELLRLPRDSSPPFLLGLDAVIVMPISWLPLVSDYSRYAASGKAARAGTFWGYFIGSSWMYSVGLIAALATRSESPDAMVMEMMANTNLAFSALGIIVLSTLTTTFLDIFSAAISAQSLWPKLPERATVAVVGLIGTILAVFFDVTSYEPFLLFIGSAFCPLFGVTLANYFVVNRQRFREAPGFQIPGLLAWAAGFVVYQTASRMGWPVGASLPSLLVAGGLHALFPGKKEHG